LSSKSTIGETYPNPIAGCNTPTRIFYTAETMASVEDVTDALRDVIDPELGLDFVELGLIYDVEVEDGVVRVTYTLTSPGCPIGPQVSEQIEEFVSELEGVQDVQPTMTFSPPWTPDRMSEDAKFALGF
jgi:metal-sulfur cluster biosynthetic enzyme